MFSPCVSNYQLHGRSSGWTLLNKTGARAGRCTDRQRQRSVRGKSAGAEDKRRARLIEEILNPFLDDFWASCPAALSTSISCPHQFWAWQQKRAPIIDETKMHFKKSKLIQIRDPLTVLVLTSSPHFLPHISLSSRCHSFPSFPLPFMLLHYSSILSLSLSISILNLSQFKNIFPNSISFLIVTVLMKISTSFSADSGSRQ